MVTILVGAFLALPVTSNVASAADAAVPAVVVNEISPTSGYATEYETVTVSGSNLAAVTAVSFGDFPAQFTLASAGALVADVPNLPVGSYPIVLNTPAGAVAASGPYTVASVENEVLRLVNEARSAKRKCGKTTYKKVKPLVWSGPLAEAALAHSTDMASGNYFSHYSSAGENIAAGYDTPAEVVKAWLKSPGHCKNIMKKSYTQLGVGYAEGGRYGTYWTQDFGKPKK